MNKNKKSFINDINNLFIDMINPLYKPETKDMFTFKSIEEYEELSKSFIIYSIDKDIFKSVSSNLKALKKCFLIHYNEKLTFEIKSKLIKNNSTKRLDEFDIEDYIAKIECSNLDDSVKLLFKDF